MKLQADRTVAIDSGRVRIEGMLAVPENAVGVVLFAHGSGSGRFSPRNQYVATQLRDGGVATLLVDLLTPKESEDRENVFDIDLLAERLLAATRWLHDTPETSKLNVGYFGASTGAAAALTAAAKAGGSVKAIVSRGGRPDLAMRVLPAIRIPTLLIVGGDDYGVIELNQRAYDALPGPKHLIIIPGATHLFEEPGTLEEVAEHAREWFRKYLAREASPSI